LNKEFCPICGTHNLHEIFHGPDYLNPSDQNYLLLECEECQLFFLSKDDIDLNFENLYPENYFPYIKRIDKRQDFFGYLNQRRAIVKKFNTVNKIFKTPGRILEVGTSTGLLLDEFRQHKWVVTGVEPSKSAVQYAKVELDLDLINQEFQPGQFPEQTFDTIMLWDVFEHLSEPMALLAEAERILKPGGWLILNIPNPDSLEKKIFGRYWAGWDLPRHQYIFSIKALRKSIQPLNLKIKKVECVTGSFGGVIISLSFFFRSKPNLTLISRIIQNQISQNFFRIITYPFLLIESAFKKSSYITVFIQREQ
jgi:SAM-dependent methyltransferase